MKTGLFFVLVSIAMVANAADKVMIKDTRVYLVQDGQKVLFNGAPATVGGELLTRSGKWCDRTVYEGSSSLPAAPSNDKMSFVLPSITTTGQHFQCDALGNPV